VIHTALSTVARQIAPLRWAMISPARLYERLDRGAADLMAIQRREVHREPVQAMENPERAVLTGGQVFRG
jgi:hypothetical protein